MVHSLIVRATEGHTHDCCLFRLKKQQCEYFCTQAKLCCCTVTTLVCTQLQRTLSGILSCDIDINIDSILVVHTITEFPKGFRIICGLPMQIAN